MSGKGLWFNAANYWQGIIVLDRALFEKICSYVKQPDVIEVLACEFLLDSHVKRLCITIARKKITPALRVHEGEIKFAGRQLLCDQVLSNQLIELQGLCLFGSSYFQQSGTGVYNLRVSDEDCSWLESYCTTVSLLPVHHPVFFARRPITTPPRRPPGSSPSP